MCRTPNATHLGILMDDAAIDLVLDLVRQLQRQTPAVLERSRNSGTDNSILSRISTALSAIF